MNIRVAIRLRSWLIAATAAWTLTGFAFGESPTHPVQPNTPGILNLAVPNCPSTDQVGSPAQLGNSNPGLFLWRFRELTHACLLELTPSSRIDRP